MSLELETHSQRLARMPNRRRTQHEASADQPPAGLRRADMEGSPRLPKALLCERRGQVAGRTEVPLDSAWRRQQPARADGQEEAASWARRRQAPPEAWARGTLRAAPVGTQAGSRCLALQSSEQEVRGGGHGPGGQGAGRAADPHVDPHCPQTGTRAGKLTCARYRVPALRDRPKHAIGV